MGYWDGFDDKFSSKFQGNKQFYFSKIKIQNLTFRISVPVSPSVLLFVQCLHCKTTWLLSNFFFFSFFEPNIV